MQGCAWRLSAPPLLHLQATPTASCSVACRQNRELEKLNQIISDEKLHLEEENTTLAQNLAAVVQEKLTPDTHINLNTPIDETLSVLRSLIMVSSHMHTSGLQF